MTPGEGLSEKLHAVIDARDLDVSGRRRETP